MAILTRDRFDTMNEAELRAEVIIPLLRVLGYLDVHEHHAGSGEKGKDIVGWKADDAGARKNLAIVAKAVAMSGKAAPSTGSAGEVAMQVQQCFGEQYLDPVSNERQIVHSVWVVSNKKISKETRGAIKSALASAPVMERLVDYLEGDKLWGMVERHLPLSIFHYAQDLAKHIPNDDPHYAADVTVSAARTLITVKEKYPGASMVSPLEFKPKFKNRAAAELFHAALMQSIESGKPADIPNSVVESVDLPGFLASLSGQTNMPVQSIRIGSAVPHNEIFVRITVTPLNGDPYVCHFVRFRTVHAGSKSMTLMSDGADGNPFTFALELYIADRRAEFTVSPPAKEVDALQWYEWLKLTSSIRKGCKWRFDDLRTGTTVFSMLGDSDFPTLLQSGNLAFFKMLADLQQRSAVPLIIPDGTIDAETVESIAEVHDVVTTGRTEGTWTTGNLTIEPTPEIVDAMLNSFANGRATTVEIAAAEETSIFGIPVPLGPVRHTMRCACLSNYAELLERADELRTGNGEITLQLTSGPDDGVVKEYSKWLPAGANNDPSAEDGQHVGRVESLSPPVMHHHSNELDQPRQTITGYSKVGRNDPCPCGSGNKYKRCHGR